VLQEPADEQMCDFVGEPRVREDEKEVYMQVRESRYDQFDFEQRWEEAEGQLADD
jgi:hypothetical protein